MATARRELFVTLSAIMDDDDATKTFFFRLIPLLAIPCIVAFQSVASRALRDDIGVLRGRRAPAAPATLPSDEDDDDDDLSHRHGLSHSDDDDDAKSSDGSVSDGTAEDDIAEPEDPAGVNDPMDADATGAGGTALPRSQVLHNNFVTAIPGLTTSLVSSDSACAPDCARCHQPFPDAFRYRCHDCLLGAELCSDCHRTLHGDTSLHNWNYCDLKESCAMRPRPDELIETVPIFRHATQCHCPAHNLPYHTVMAVMLSGAVILCVRYWPRLRQ